MTDKVRHIIDHTTGERRYTDNMNLDGLQMMIGQWADKTFPKATVDSVLAHFQEEAFEFLDDGDHEEGADVLTLLLHYFHKTGRSLHDELLLKFEKNTARTWATEPNEKGYFKHVTENVS